MVQNLLCRSWQKFKKSESGFVIFRKTFLVGAVTLLARLLFVARDLIIAWVFGRSQTYEVFVLAFLIPYAFSNTLSHSLTITFLPALIKHREAGDFELANRNYESLFVLLLIFSLLGTMFLILGYPLYSPLAEGSFSTESLRVLRFLLYITAPASFFAAIANLWKELLNAEGKFFQSSIVSIFTPLASIVLLTFSRNTGVLALSLGLLVGALIELFLLSYFLKKQKFNLFPKGKIFAENISSQLKEWRDVFIGFSMNNAIGVVDSLMASRRSELGGLAALSYGRKVVSLPVDIASTAFSAVLIPHLSRTAAKEDWRRLLKTLNYWLAVIFATTLPIVLLIIFAAKPVIRILFERGAFTAADTEVVSVILTYYVFQLPFYVMFFVMMRVLPIVDKHASAIFWGGAGLTLTIFFNILFIKFFGTSGIALATSCVYFLLAVSLYFYLSKKISSKAAALAAGH